MLITHLYTGVLSAPSSFERTLPIQLEFNIALRFLLGHVAIATVILAATVDVWRLNSPTLLSRP
ncbi:MAG: hypothetical protein ACFB0G_01700 [Leptolyngbyaceae cyanobacterium]